MSEYDDEFRRTSSSSASSGVLDGERGSGRGGATVALTPAKLASKSKAYLARTKIRRPSAWEAIDIGKICTCVHYTV